MATQKSSDEEQDRPVEASSPGKIVRKSKKSDTLAVDQHKDALWQLLDSRIGGKEGFLALTMASSDPRARDLAEMLCDPAFSRWGTKALARKAGLSASEIVDMYRDAKKLEAILSLHEDLPEVLRDAVIDARAAKVPCPACKAKKVDENGEECYQCSGTGQIRKPGDKDKLNFVGKAAELIDNKVPLIQNNLQVNNNTMQGGNSFEDLMRKAVLVVPKKEIEGVKEAEVVGD